MIAAVITLLNTNAIANSVSSSELPCTGPCDLRTQTQGGWGAAPKGDNPGAYLHENFSSKVFPNGIVVGGVSSRESGDGCKGYYIKLTSAAAVTAFLPSGGTPRPLDGSYTDPTNSLEKIKGKKVYDNTLAGQAVALTISIGFDKAFDDFGAGDAHLEDAVIADVTSPFYNRTVAEVLAEANRVLSGCTSVYSASQLNDAMSSINESFTDGIKRSDFLVCPLPPLVVEIGDVPVCDEATTLTARIVSGGGGSYTYVWSGPDGVIIDEDNDGMIQVTVAGIYSVTVTDVNGCVGEDDIEADVFVSPVLEVSVPGAACGPSVTVNLADAIVSPEDLNRFIVTYWNSAPGANDGDAAEDGIDPIVAVAGTYWIKIYDRETGCSDEALVVVSIAPVCPGVQGCTLGYWKNHLDRWCGGQYNPSTEFADVFDNVPVGFDEDITLEEALNLGGGGIYNLARQGVAALLNACSGEVEFALTVDQVIRKVNEGFLGDAGEVGNYLDELNNAGCPLGGTRATTSSVGGESNESSIVGIAGNHLTAYPTPFSDKATIEFTTSQTGNYVVNLYDMRGALVKQLKSGVSNAGELNKVEVDGKDMSDGLYLAHIVSESGARTVKLLLKK